MRECPQEPAAIPGPLSNRNPGHHDQPRPPQVRSGPSPSHWAGPGPRLCSDRNQESGIPAGILLRNGPCQVRFRNTRFQELPEGVPWLGYLLVHCPTLGSTVLRFSPEKKNSGANRDGAEERSVPYKGFERYLSFPVSCPPMTHATCGNSSTRSSRMKRGSGDRNAFAVATCTGTSRRPRSSSTSASSLHARLQQSSNRARELTKTSTRTSKLQCIHAAEFAAKSALKLAKEQ